MPPMALGIGPTMNSRKDGGAWIYRTIYLRRNFPKRLSVVQEAASRPALDGVAGIIANPVGGPDEADSETKKEEDDLDRQTRHARIIGIRQDIEERKKYAGRIFYLV